MYANEAVNSKKCMWTRFNVLHNREAKSTLPGVTSIKVYSANDVTQDEK